MSQVCSVERASLHSSPLPPPLSPLSPLYHRGVRNTVQRGAEGPWRFRGKRVASLRYQVLCGRF